MAVAVPAVRDNDPGVAGADQRVEGLAVAMLGDLQEHGARGVRGPQRARNAPGSPAGLIDMHRRRVEHLVAEVQMWACQRVGGALADRVGRAGRQAHTEQIASQFAHPAPRHTIGGGQGHQRRLQPRTERRASDLRRQARAGPRTAAPAAQLVRAMLSEDHADRRQLGNLMATEAATRTLLIGLELSAARATHGRIVIDDLIHLIGRLQFTASATVPLLSALLTALTLPAQKLLRLRSRLRPPLRPRLRRILRRRPRTRAGVLTRLLLQPLQTILVLLDPARQRQNELDARLTTRVIDRLRLHAVHNRKIRCTKQESLPTAPTTERLQV